MKGMYRLDREFDDSRLQENKRGQWANKLEFILACFGNVWGGIRPWTWFPYLCYKFGGLPVFLVVYVIMLAHIGFPLLLLEMTLGQYSSRGVLTVWWMCPLFMGVGVCILLYLSVLISTYLSVMSWPVYYWYVSFSSAWMSCDNYWNTPGCFDGAFLNKSERIAVYDVNTDRMQVSDTRSPIEEYFTNYFISEGSPSSLEISEIHWKKIVCLAVCWIIIALCLCLGVRSLGKAVYLTTLVPPFLLVPFLVRALTLPGAKSGMLFLFTTNFQQLTNPMLWLSAAFEVIYGMGLGYGGFLTLSSYNRFRNFYQFDAIIILLVHVIVRVIIAVTVFGFVGFLAHEYGKSFGSVITTGSASIFVLIPEALTKLANASIWCNFFFLLVFFMMLGQALAMVEVISTALSDLWPPLQRFRFITPVILSCAFFLVGILFCTPAGQYLRVSLDVSIVYPPMVLVCAMSVCVALFYGLCKVRHDVVLMLGGRHVGFIFIAGLTLIPAAVHWLILPLTSIALLVLSALTDPFIIRGYFDYVCCATMAIIMLPMLLCPFTMFIISCCSGCKCAFIIQPDKRWGPKRARFRNRATHLPHLNTAPSTEGVQLERLECSTRYDI